MKLITALEDAIELMANPDLKSACRVITNDRQFALWPAAIGMHHAYPGGLVSHTAEVLGYAVYTASSLPGKVDLDVLITACLWHDYAKIHEYRLVEGDGLSGYPEACVPKETGHAWWEKDVNYLHKIGHIAGSTAAFYHTALTRGVAQATIDAVCHCILSHHGPVREWGSPVAPQSLEAHLLHHADVLSAKFGATKDRP